MTGFTFNHFGEHDHSLARLLMLVVGLPLWYADPGVHDLTGLIGIGMTVLAGLGFLMQGFFIAIDFSGWVKDRRRANR